MPIDWYAARTAGILAYLILTVVVLVGLTLSGQVRMQHWPKFAVTDLHRFGGLLVATFVSIHVATIAIDAYLRRSHSPSCSCRSAPPTGRWTAFGIVGAELLVALAVTNRSGSGSRTLVAAAPRPQLRRLGRRDHARHRIRHGARTLWMGALYAVSVSSVLGALAWRLASKRLALRLSKASPALPAWPASRSRSGWPPLRTATPLVHKQRRRRGSPTASPARSSSKTALPGRSFR